jgi:hypothetical protein
LIALIDEDFVIDMTLDDGELGAGDMLCGELGIVCRRGLSVVRADGDSRKTDPD